MLKEHFQPVEGEFQFAKASDCETTDEIQTFLEESVKDGCEGLMVKMLESDASYYEPSRRSVNWLKVRLDELHVLRSAAKAHVAQFSSKKTIWRVLETPWT